MTFAYGKVSGWGKLFAEVLQTPISRNGCDDEPPLQIWPVAEWAGMIGEWMLK